MELLGKFEIANKADSYPAELSGGQRQRVSIIQQMMCSSHFLLMDEPFSGLDPIAKAQACDLILSLSQVDELNTSIITTHDIDTAITVADTIWLMGRDRDANGKSIGAKIQKFYDLAALGLAWDPDIRSRPAFQQLSVQIHQDFQTL
jgi:ABC-type nitrate/sulfonate/bicarbonate transport system ATPase subunit